jgi:acyl carrier protein
MTAVGDRVMEAFCVALNKVKRAGFSVQQLRPEAYLGGDLGVDSVEMLEIWYDVEQLLAVHVPDEEKRGILTIGEVVGVFARKL